MSCPISATIIVITPTAQLNTMQYFAERSCLLCPQPGVCGGLYARRGRSREDVPVFYCMAGGGVQAMLIPGRYLRCVPARDATFGPARGHTYPL